MRRQLSTMSFFRVSRPENCQKCPNFQVGDEMGTVRVKRTSNTRSPRQRPLKWPL